MGKDFLLEDVQGIKNGLFGLFWVMLCGHSDTAQNLKRKSSPSVQASLCFTFIYIL